MPKRARKIRRPRGVLLGTLLIVAFAATSSPAQPSDLGTLHLINGDYVRGQLLGSPNRERVLWEAVGFESPLDLALWSLEEIRWGQPSGRNKTPTRAEAQHRVLLRNGTTMFGQIAALDAAHLLLRSERHGEVQLKRQAVSLVENIGDGSALYADMDYGLDGWKSGGEPFAGEQLWSNGHGRDIPGWQWSSGKLQAKRQGATLFHPCPGARKFEIELQVAAATRPKFRLTVATSADLTRLKDGYNLETWENDLVTHRQQDTKLRHKRLGRIRPKGSLFRSLFGRKTRPRSNYDLRILVDTETGLLQVFSDGLLFGEFQTPATPVPADAGVFLRNQGPSLLVERFRIRRWHGEVVAGEDGAGEDGAGEDGAGEDSKGENGGKTEAGASIPPKQQLVLSDGTKFTARSFHIEPDSGRLTAEGESSSQGSAATSWDLVRLDRLRFAPLLPPAPRKLKPRAIEVAYDDGSVLAGEILEILEGAVRVEADYAAAPFLLGFQGARQARFFTSGGRRAVADAKAALLEQPNVRLHGSVEGVAGGTASLPWRSVYSRQPSVVHLAETAQVTYPEPSQSEREYAREDEIHLRDGDVVGVRVLAADTEEIRVELPGGHATRIPCGQVKAVRFAGKRGGRSATFSEGSPWTFNGAARADGGRVSFGGEGTATRKLTGANDNYIRFALRFDGSGALTIQPGWDAHGAGRGRFMMQMPSGFMLAVKGDTATVTSYDQMMRRRLKPPAEPPKIPLGIARTLECEIFADSRRRVVEFYAGGKLVATSRIPRNLGAPTSLVFSRGEDNGLHQVVFAGGRVVRRTQTGKSRDTRRILLERFDATNTVGLPAPATRERVLTRSRGTPAAHLTHVLRAFSGDLLRGRWVGLDDTHVHFRLRARTIQVPRGRVAEIIALDVENEESAPNPARFRVELAGRRSVTLTSLRAEGQQIIGESRSLGEIRLPTNAIVQLSAGPQGDTPSAYDLWALRDPVPLPVAACAPGGDATAAPASPLVGKAAPSFQLTDIAGNATTLAAHKGKVVIVDFWATWCGPCIAALPSLMKVAATYRDRGVVLLAINQQEASEDVTKFLERKKWKLNVLLDKDGGVGQAYGVDAIPRTVIIDADGVVRQVHVGLLPDLQRTVADELDEILATKKF